MKTGSMQINQKANVHSFKNYSQSSNCVIGLDKQEKQAKPLGSWELPSSDQFKQYRSSSINYKDNFIQTKCYKDNKE